MKVKNGEKKCREEVTLKWNMITVTEKAIQCASETHEFSEEDAFDFLLELLETGEAAELLSTNNFGDHLFRIEQDYMIIRENRLIRYYRDNYPKRLRFKVHRAEDGRCEHCEKPMDRRVARLQRVTSSVINDFNNYLLLCPDCHLRQPDPLESAWFSDQSVQIYQEKRDITTEDARSELLTTKAHLVLVNAHKDRRRYWAPGLGNFRLVDGVLELERINDTPVPVLQRKPQKRSRRWTESDT